MKIGNWDVAEDGTVSIDGVSEFIVYGSDGRPTLQMSKCRYANGKLEIIPTNATIEISDGILAVNGLTSFPVYEGQDGIATKNIRYRIQEEVA